MSFTTIDNAQQYFAVTVYAGTENSNAQTNVGHQPNMIWVKNRSATSNHHVVDSVRGITKELRFNLTNSEADDNQLITSFDSDGFTVGTSGSGNTNSNNYVAWTWKESATSGFDIVSFTGNGSARTISHSLSAVPEWIIVKKRSGTDAGAVYHVSNGNNNGLLISEHNANDDELYWNDTTPTSSVFTLGTLSNVNQNSETYISYLWSPKQGFSKFGKFFGNGDASSPPFIYTGFRPAFVMLKVTNTTDSWNMYDNKRNGFNGTGARLRANITNAEDTGTEYQTCDFYSNGFAPQGTDTTSNGSTRPYIYMCFAESPFVNSKGIPTNAR